MGWWRASPWERCRNRTCGLKPRDRGGIISRAFSPPRYPRHSTQGDALRHATCFARCMASACPGLVYLGPLARRARTPSLASPNTGIEAERATNTCITLCIKGLLRSRWSVQMTGFGGGFVRTTVVLRLEHDLHGIRLRVRCEVNCGGGIVEGEAVRDELREIELAGAVAFED